MLVGGLAIAAGFGGGLEPIAADVVVCTGWITIMLARIEALMVAASESRPE